MEGLVSEPVEAYRLLPIGIHHPTFIRFPVANADDYTDKSNALEEGHFKQEIRQGTCRDSMRIVKTFRFRIAQTRARNKKPPVAYERILKQASQRSLEELSVALEMSVDDVRLLFEQRFDESEN